MAAYFSTIPESFHYLMANNRTESLIKWIENANYFAKWNNSPKFIASVKDLCTNTQSNVTNFDKKGFL